MKQSKEMDQLKKVQLEHLEFLEKQNEQVLYLKGITRHRQTARFGRQMPHLQMVIFLLKPVA